MRRLVHVLLVIAIVTGVRACGSDEAENRLASGVRWMAEKTGVAYVTTAWGERVRPGIGRAAAWLTHRLNAGLSAAFERTTSGVSSLAGWIWEQVTGAISTAAQAVRTLFLPQSSDGPETPGERPPEAAAT